MAVQLDNFVKMKPEDCLNLNFEQSLELVKKIIGNDLWECALNFKIESPYLTEKNTNWSKKAKFVGINPRITKTFWGIVKYAITFPENAVHIMPLFETGDGSLYVQNSWELNNDFIDKDLCKLGFNTAELQLKFVINILHAMGKAVGFDVLAHVDNFSEIVLLNPKYFEWIKLNSSKTSQDFSKTPKQNASEIEKLIISYFKLPDNFYQLDENIRESLLFPSNIDKFKRRMEIRKLIRDNGYEPVPVVEHCPMRPIVFEKMEYSKNDSWAVFTVKDKSEYSKIFGAVTPYKFYDIKDGYPVKNSFDEEVLQYFIGKIFEFQKEYDFDFLRADMAHNQISQSHNSSKDLETPEMWAILKKKINESKPYFATIAEAFLNDYYISGVQDMVNKDFDVVLGELNFHYLNENYIDIVKCYNAYSQKYNFAPSITVFTNDGDLPEHKNLYKTQEANECRFFSGLFLNMPLYTAIGFETRDLSPEDKSMYSNYYVVKQNEDYTFGSNERTFETFYSMRRLYAKYKDIIENAPLTFINPRGCKMLSWYYALDNGQKLLFAINLDSSSTVLETDLSAWSKARLIYTNSLYNEIIPELENDNGSFFVIPDFYIGECVIYELE